MVICMSASGRTITEPIEYADSNVSDIQELIDLNPYFVIVASPATSHAEHTIPLIESGIPVLIEKPVTASLDDLALIVNTATKNPAKISVAYCLRYLSSSKKIKQLLDEQLIGSLYNVSANIGQYLPSWRESKDYLKSVSANKSLGGGALLELSHEFDYLQWLLGDLKHHDSQLRTSKELNLEVEELADVVLTTDNGTICNIHLDFIQKYTQRKCSFIGSKGRLDWDLINNSISLYDDTGEKMIYSEPEWNKNNMYINMLNDFVSYIENKENKCINIVEAGKTVELIQEIKKEASWGIKQ